MPSVVALPHALCRVVGLPEHLEQLAVRDPLRVEDHPDGLRVPGPAAADLLVGRIRGVPALVADGGGNHARYLPECLLRAPETAQCELRHARTLGVRRPQRGIEYFVAAGDRHWRRAAGQRLLRADHLGLAETEYAHDCLLRRRPRGVRTTGPSTLKPGCGHHPSPRAAARQGRSSSSAWSWRGWGRPSAGSEPAGRERRSPAVPAHAAAAQHGPFSSDNSYITSVD